ncbi:amidohydrolase family protein [Bacillus infantis]|uniref:amidohydrolase family protein n=1 Tax=Bacillus infantis TaxID=324767 RepID=UPI003982AB15
MKDNSKLLLYNANLIEVISGTVKKASIFISHGYIDEVFYDKERLNGEVPPDVKRINGEGKWIIPGLIDMHVHIKEGFAPFFTASGVTAVRNTGGNVLELADLIKASTDAPTPRVYSADRVIDGPPGLWGETSPWNVNIEDSQTARQEVNRQIEAGADFVKVYGWLSKEMMESVCQEARSHGKEVSCDLIYSSHINAVEAGRIGIKWNEHASGVLQAMYPQWSMGADQSTWDAINWHEPDFEKINTVCRQLIDLDVKICPTMTLFDGMDRGAEYWKPLNEVTSRILESKALIGQWQTLSQYEDALKSLGVQHQINKAIAKAYFDLGGTVVAGTDTPAGIWTFPGMALHRELELFVEAGFSEIDAIRSATCTAAEAINQSDLGVIRAGARADMVILNQNPLADIRHTKDIYSVIKGGKIFTQSEILDKVPDEESASKRAEEFIKDFNLLLQ